VETTLNRRELLSLAVHGEKASFALYSRAAEESKYDSVKKIFRRIARDELEHLMRLLERFQRLYPDLTREVNISLPIPSESDVRRLSEITGPSEALQRALQEERRSLHIYLQLVKAMESKGATAILRTIIRDEVSHIKALRSIREARIIRSGAKEKRLH
jgi:rubrerythrin